MRIPLHDIADRIDGYEPGINKRNCRQQYQRRQNRTQDGDESAKPTTDFISHENRSIDRNSAGRGLGNRRKIQHFLFGNPPQLVHELLFHQGYNDITASKGKGADLECL